MKRSGVRKQPNEETNEESQIRGEEELNACTGGEQGWGEISTTWALIGWKDEWKKGV